MKGEGESMDYRKEFLVQARKKLKLKKIDPNFKDRYVSEDSAKEETEKETAKLRGLQYRMYAEGKRSLLICLQSMDAGGKDGIIRHVLGAMNPLGCRVEAFKVPSAEEAAHDFLWRVHKVMPSRGHVSVFNRSHYEDVLVVRVHKLTPKKVWWRRYDEINAFESHLVDNGTHVLKFFLHISKEEQLRRFKQRLEDPTRQWKISENDYTERDYWADYMKAYEDTLANTSTSHAPWFVIPANHKWFRNLAVSQIVTGTLESFKMQLPTPKGDLAALRKAYHQVTKEESARSGKRETP